VIRLHYANRLENLLAPLAEVVADCQGRRPLERLHVIVPNRVVEQFVKLRLCERIGVAANLEFPFLRRYLARVVQEANPALKILEAEDLQLVLFECLRGSIHLDAPELRPVRHYAEAGSKTPADVELRLFQLAGQVARLFREYSITRRAMIARWQRGRIQNDAGPFDEAERWQRYLWLKVFGADLSVRPDWLAAPEYQWMLLPDGFDATDRRALKSALPPVLHVFGLAYAGPAFAKMFADLGELIELHIYALNPCLEFWEDVQSPAGIERDRWVRRRQKLAVELQSAADPFGLDGGGNNPALRLWARPGREYIRLLNELTDCDFDPHFSRREAGPDAPQSAPSLLHQLQESILIREAERAPVRDAANLPIGSPADSSIRFLACPGVRREAEIVADTIWSLIEQEPPAGSPLRFHEIAVLVPDRAYDDYLPHLEAAFAASHEIPVEVVNRRFASESRVAEAIGMLLRLPLGRFTRDEMLHLLTHPAITGEAPELDTAQWARWCDALGIYFGADRDDLAGTYIRDDLFNWDQALKRLALGVFMSGGDPRFFAAADGREFLPHEVAQDEVTAAAGMVRTARSLLSDACEIRSRQLAFGEWARILGDLISTYVRVTDPIDERIRDYCISAIESIAPAGIRSDPVSCQIACEAAAARIADAESRRGQFGERGVAVGPLSALRSIPFKVIFLLGLNEAGFPERPRHDPLDLRLVKRIAGDVTPTERDRYLFAETLLAARERVFLSYVSRDQRTADPLEPSAAIRELQFILRGYVDEAALEHLTVEHPMSRYDLRYFPELDPDRAGPDAESELFSFDPTARRGARMAALRLDLARHCGDAALPGRGRMLLSRLSPPVQKRISRELRIMDLSDGADGGVAARGASAISLPLAALRRFLECPVQGAARYALGMREDQDDAGEDHQDEPVAQSILDRTVMLREAFWKSRGDRGSAAHDYRDRFRIAQAQGRAPAGLFAEEANSADLMALGEWLDQAREAGARDLADWQEIRIGRGDEFASADRLLDEIALEVAIPLADSTHTRTVKIHGALGFVSPAMDASIRCVLRDEPKAKDFLPLFFSALALAASGATEAKEFAAIVVSGAGGSGKRRIKRFRLPQPEAARAYLAALAADLLSDENYYFLPIEAVEKIWRAWKLTKEETKKRAAGGVDLIDLIDGVRENEQSRCSSDYGPIRNARRFDPPGESELKSIVERRFGPIGSIFEY